MFGEAKIALVLGVGLVISGAVVFFHRDLVQASTPPDAIAPATSSEKPIDNSLKGTTHLRSAMSRPM